MADSLGKERGDEWKFTSQSIGTTVAESRDAAPTKSEGNWFDYFFGPIPAKSQTSQEGRENAEETREGDTSGTAGGNENNSAADIFNGFISWLDPAPHVPFSHTLAECTGKNNQPKEKTNYATPRQEQESGDVSQENVADKPGASTVSTRNLDGAPLDGVQFAISEDPVNDNDSTSVVSKASSAVTSQGKMFGDLDSVPSVKGDTIMENESVKTSDLDNHASMSVMDKNAASVVEEKAKQIKIPKKAAPSPESLSPTFCGIKVDARRQLLLQELQSTVATFGQYDVRVASINQALGDLFDESKKHDQAIKMHRDAVDIYMSKLGDDHNTTLDAKLRLGHVLENGEKHDEAIGLYYQVTMMRRAVRGEKDPSSADSLVRMAAALKKKGDYQPAIKELKRALKIYREALGDAHEKVSVTVDEIASLYVTLGDFEKASAILEEVVKLKAATKGMKSKAVATTLITLATTYECSEDFNKAMKSLKKAYKIHTDMDGYSSLDATNTLNRIAQLYEATGDNDRASIAYLGVLRGRKINFGEDHLKVAETYFKLGHSLRHSGQQEKALKCMKEALPIFVSKGVELNDVEMIAEVMHEMALINKEKHRYAEATRIFKQELGVRRKIGQPEFPMIARTLNHLGVTEYEMKNNNKSLKYLIEALTIYKDNAERSVECAEVLFNTGLVFESSRNKDRAMDAYNEAARIFREHGYKENHPHLLKATRKMERLQAVKNLRK